MSHFISSLLGPVGQMLLGLKGGNTPKVSGQPAADTETEANKAAASRSALFQTEGGAQGEELSPNQVGKRDTLFGN